MYARGPVQNFQFWIESLTKYEKWLMITFPSWMWSINCTNIDLLTFVNTSFVQINKYKRSYQFEINLTWLPQQIEMKYEKWTVFISFVMNTSFFHNFIRIKIKKLQQKVGIIMNTRLIHIPSLSFHSFLIYSKNPFFTFECNSPSI